MVQRGSYQTLSMLFGLAGLIAGCDPGDVSVESSSIQADPTTTVSPTDNTFNGAVSDKVHTSTYDAGVSTNAANPTTAKADASVVTNKSDASVSSKTDASVQTPSDAGVVAAQSLTLKVSGNQILDTCGKPWMARGMEQLAATQFSPGDSLKSLAAELAKTGSNAVRLLPQVDSVGASDIDALLTAFASQNIVVYLSPGDRSWFKRDDVRKVLLSHERGIILDAFQEPNYDDVPRWLNETKAAIADLRSAGYSAPLTVLSNQYGRDLTTALDHGQEVVDSDPKHNTIIGWQAYWGNSGWYQKAAGLTLTQGVEKAATKNFPFQLGVDQFADANELMNYAEVMAAAQKTGLGWLWWNFWNKWDGLGNNASNDGTATNLTTVGDIVIRSDPNSIANTAKKACFR